MRKTLFSVAFLCFLSRLSLSEILDEKELTNLQNYIHNFNISHLPDFLQNRKYVVMYFDDKQCHSRTCLKRMIKYRKLSFKFLKEEVFFLRIEVNSPAEAQETLGLSVPSLPHFSMSCFEFKKNFLGQIDHLRLWIKETLDHIPLQISSLDQVHKTDKHYFVYLNKTDFDLEDFDLAMLTKLIHPLSLYFGISPDSEDPKFKNLIEKSGNSTLLAFREYDEFILPLDPKEEIHFLAQKIRDHEFPENCNLTLKTMQYITHHQLPTFLYFDYSPHEKPFYETFLKLSKEYNNYLMFCTLDLNQVNDSGDYEFVFHTNFLAGGVPRKSNKGFMRIVYFTDRFRRFRVFGNLNDSTAHFLIKNYLNDNLKEFVANESLGEKNFIRLASGIRKINKTKFDELLTHKVTTHLVYVYSSTTKSLKTDINILMTLTRAIEKNKHFSISVMDHDRNDLDGQVHSNLPYLVLSNSTFQRKAFKGNLNFVALLTFLADNVSWLKLNENFLEELKNDYGIDLFSKIQSEDTK